MPEGIDAMKSIWVLSLCLALNTIPATAFAQAFGEYGRAVGSVPHGRGMTGSGTSGRSGQGGVSGGGVGDLGGHALPARLVVVNKDAGLFPRQDEESKKIAQLAEGQKLIPMLQTEGAGRWYMIKTETGLVGWVKSSEVRPEKAKQR